MTLLDKIKKKNWKLFEQERKILNLTEIISGIIQDENVDIDVLCKKLNKSPRWLNKFLDGRGKMKFRDICDIFTVLGYELDLNVTKGFPRTWQ